MMESLNAAGLASFIRSGQCKRIGFLTGAGISCAAGIPDFRSPGGMYDSLRPELLTATSEDRAAMEVDPVNVVTWDLFQRNPLPYHEVRRPFILGTQRRQWKATAAHYMMRCFHDRGLLQRVYSQNIDGIDYQTGVPPEKIVPCHGSIATPGCEFCHKDGLGAEKYCELVQTSIKDIYGVDPDAPAESTPIVCPECNKPGVKPTTVLFGRSLPAAFFECSATDLSQLDMLIVVGTSLAVFPAAGLVSDVSAECVRAVSYTHLRAHETVLDLVCRLLLEKKKK
eukprot:TRINITY_DN343_c0_g1_i5.p1 TRINITY_DN343_c0_g1~~TRINITY_DN343_c0_g1_i5.p1  ORF type:complete len:282 (-),score=36.72 TRINITY_DN343_c0_g1_i5:30-875(-)